jgi:hypothetical protein
MTTLPGHAIVGLIPAGQLSAAPIPIVAGRWFDNRQTCKLVHDYLEGAIEGRFEEYRACRSYAAGVCAGTGGAGLLCLFHEPDRSLAWAQARRWQRVALPDGITALQKRPSPSLE